MSEILEIIKVLNDENRLKIITMLKGQEMCACKLLEELDITQPTLSHHMKLLLRVNLIHTKKDGKWSYYSLNNQTLKSISDYFGDLCD